MEGLEGGSGLGKKAWKVPGGRKLEQVAGFIRGDSGKGGRLHGFNGRDNRTSRTRSRGKRLGCCKGRQTGTGRLNWVEELSCGEYVGKSGCVFFLEGGGSWMPW